MTQFFWVSGHLKKLVAEFSFGPVAGFMITGFSLSIFML